MKTYIMLLNMGLCGGMLAFVLTFLKVPLPLGYLLGLRDVVYWARSLVVSSVRQYQYIHSGSDVHKYGYIHM